MSPSFSIVIPDTLAIAEEAVGDWPWGSAGRGAQQRVSELTWVLTTIAPRGPMRILEIGVHDGGSLWAWSQIMAEGGQCYGVDLTIDNLRDENLTADKRMQVFIGDSGDPEFAKFVASEFDGPIDFLFIDGDHSREAVVRDYQTWEPYTAKNAVIGFDDTFVAAREGWLDVLAMQTDTFSTEITARDHPTAKVGIGLLVKGFMK